SKRPCPHRRRSSCARRHRRVHRHRRAFSTAGSDSARADMALLDLSLVTKTLVEVVKRAINASPAKPGGVINITGLPPDRLGDLDNAVGIYLYHCVEEAAIKNAYWRGRPQQPIRFSPIGLNLHYIVSAHSKNELSEGPYREQLLMGLTTKALHDYPIIDD